MSGSLVSASRLCPSMAGSVEWVQEIKPLQLSPRDLPAAHSLDMEALAWMIWEQVLENRSCIKVYKKEMLREGVAAVSGMSNAILEL